MNQRRASLQDLSSAMRSHELVQAYVNKDSASFEDWLVDKAASTVKQARQRHAQLLASHSGQAHLIPELDLIIVKDILGYAQSLSYIQAMSSLLKARLVVHHPSQTVGQIVNTAAFTDSLAPILMSTVALFQQSTLDAVSINTY
jgi:hypothetical protein